MENPLYGSSVCCVDWTAYTLTTGSEEPSEILIHNPHSFGNETAIDEMLSSTALWTDIEFEKGVISFEYPTPKERILKNEEVHSFNSVTFDIYYIICGM